MTSLSIIRILLDGGLVVLIWMVQLVIYPSFLYYRTENLIKWHKKYMSSFSFIVIPLMFGQLGISICQLITQPNTYTFISLLIIIVLWISTFIQFAPIHLNISNKEVNKKMLISLVNKNWIRTFLWSLLFIYSLFKTNFI